MEIWWRWVRHLQNSKRNQNIAYKDDKEKDVERERERDERDIYMSTIVDQHENN